MLEQHEEALAAAATARNREPDNYWPKETLAHQLVSGAGDIPRDYRDAEAEAGLYAILAEPEQVSRLVALMKKYRLSGIPSR